MKKIFYLWVVCLSMGSSETQAEDSEFSFWDTCVLSSESSVGKSSFFDHVKAIFKSMVHDVTGISKVAQPIIFISSPIAQDKVAVTSDPSQWKVTLFRPNNESDEKSKWLQDEFFFGLNLERSF